MCLRANRSGLTCCDVRKNAAEVAAADLADFLGRKALCQHVAGDGIDNPPFWSGQILLV